MMVSMKPNVVGCCTTALHKQQGCPAAAWIGHFSTGMERGEVNTVSVQPKGRKTAGGFRHSPVWKIFLHWLYLKSASGLWAWRAFSRWKNSLIRRSFFDISFFFFLPSSPRSVLKPFQQLLKTVRCLWQINTLPWNLHGLLANQNANWGYI